MEIKEVFEGIDNFLNQFVLFKAIKFFLGFYIILMFVTIVLALIRMINKYAYLNTLLEGQEFKDVKSGVFQSRWGELMKLIEGENEAGWKAGVLDASLMLDEVLGTIGYAGDTLGQKLENILPEQLENLEKIKKANNVKNEIVNNKDFSISKEDARELVKIFEDALRFFEAID